MINPNVNGMTEEEAREKWCPQARVAFMERNLKGKLSCLQNTTSHNRITITGEPSYTYAINNYDSACVASKCMFWRWCSESHDKGYCGRGGE